MKDSSKTNQELIAEISVLKKRIRELENSEAERTRAEEALQLSRERLEDSQRIAKIGDWEADLCTGELYWSQVIFDIFGFDSKSFKPSVKAFYQAVHPDDRDLVLESENRSEQTGLHDVIHRIIRPNGEVRIIHELARRYTNEKGKLIMLRGTVQDITERRQAEEALYQSRNFLQNIIDSSESYIYVVDLEGRFLLVNRQLATSFGIAEGEIIGRRREHLMPKALAKEHRKNDLGVIKSQQTTIFEENSLIEDIEHTYLSVKFPLKNPSGEIYAIGGISTDITDRKRMEEEKRSLEERLLRAEKMEALGQLAGGVAHDLNNVLGILSGYSELLLEEIPEGHRSRGHVEKILQSTEKGAAIIQDLLTLARRGVTATDVTNLTTVVTAFLRTPVFEKIKDYHPRVIFKTECDENLLNIKGSAVHLEKALMNLVSNAAEAISGKGEVTIRTENRYIDTPIRGYDEIKQGDYCALTVSDTGMGIPVENREKIFEPFYTKKTMGRSGTGLGLSIVWGTVKDHNGYIDLQTEVGKGTTFTLYFPVTREELIVPQKKAPIEQYMGKGESVLVVDDIAEQRDVATRLLTRLGYEVQAVSSGEEAVEYIREHRADILVLDMIMMPGIDGLETYQRVLEINPKQKAIIVSGFSETNRVKEAQKLGAGAYAKKPYMMERIGMAIRLELDRK